MTTPGRLVFGLGLMALGALYLLDTADVLDAGETVGDWWPVLLIALGLVQLSRDRSSWFGPGVLILVGVVLLGTVNDVVDDNVWSYLWPVVVIGAGVWIVTGRRRAAGVVTAAGDDVVAILSSRQVAADAGPFTSAEVTAVLGSVEFDLTQAELAEGATIAATVLLGSIEIFVPEGWRVRLSGTPVLGGWDDTTRRDRAGPDAPTLEINATTILGGLEVRHPKRFA